MILKQLPIGIKCFCNFCVTILGLFWVINWHIWKSWNSKKLKKFETGKIMEKVQNKPDLPMEVAAKSGPCLNSFIYNAHKNQEQKDQIFRLSYLKESTTLLQFMNFFKVLIDGYMIHTQLGAAPVCPSHPMCATCLTSVGYPIWISISGSFTTANKN